MSSDNDDKGIDAEVEKIKEQVASTRIGAVLDDLKDFVVLLSQGDSDPDVVASRLNDAGITPEKTGAMLARLKPMMEAALIAFVRADLVCPKCNYRPPEQIVKQAQEVQDDGEPLSFDYGHKVFVLCRCCHEVLLLDKDKAELRAPTREDVDFGEDEMPIASKLLVLTSLAKTLSNTTRDAVLKALQDSAAVFDAVIESKIKVGAIKWIMIALPQSAVTPIVMSNIDTDTDEKEKAIIAIMKDVTLSIMHQGTKARKVPRS